MRAFVRTVWLVVVIACDGGKKPSAPPPVPGGSGSAVAAPVLVDAAALPPIDAALPGGVPGLSLADVDDAQITKSWVLNTGGFRHHGKKQYSEAIKLYGEALALDPGNLLARYNLASALTLRGDHPTALALLAQFKVPDCRACTGILLHAAKDSDWKALHADPTFQSIVAGLVADKIDQKKIYKDVIAALRTGSADGLEPYFHPRSAVTIDVFTYSPEEDKTTLLGWKAFTAWLKPHKGLDGPNPDASIVCEKNCCNYGPRGDSSYVVDSVCFAGPGGVLFVSAIRLDPGSI
jgi:TPR repeat